MNFVAIDPATHTGWATNNPEVHGTWDLRVKRDESDGMRVLRFKSKFQELCRIAKPDVVGFERPAGRNARGIITQSELIGIIKSFCIENHIEYRAYSSTELKKFATGKGNSGKDLMIQAAREKLSYSGDNDNEADALWILELLKHDLL